MRVTYLLNRMRYLPLLGVALSRVFVRFGRGRFKSSSSYWEQRYRRGGSSGMGSFGVYARFKAEIVNRFLVENHVASVIEFGCGDGNQLSMMTYPRYIGLDVSQSAIDLCKKRFSGDATKSFLVYESPSFVAFPQPLSAEAAISLDVIYHLVEDEVFENYLDNLFAAATKFVIIFSSDTDANPVFLAPHVKHRRFSETIAHKMPGWQRIQEISNPIEPRNDNEQTAMAANFYIYQKR